MVYFRCEGWLHEQCSGLDKNEWRAATSEESIEWVCQLCEDWDIE